MTFKTKRRLLLLSSSLVLFFIIDKLAFGYLIIVNLILIIVEYRENKKTKEDHIHQ
ncbi:hypothetical protein ACFQ0R_04490 [Psychroflexus salinarum]|uniref:Uncharacterized protein n=1 Tax=Psychroflexus salinarum TaxID=546024 RepID=A0ABW3GQA6_9FLAO